MGDRPLTTEGELDYAGYYRDRTGANYEGATLSDFACANDCPSIVNASTRTQAQGAYPAGRGWVFRTPCFTGLLNLEAGRACVCGWPHSQALDATTCGTAAANDAEPGSRSCQVDYGICGGDSGGNCCDPADASCLYSRNAAPADSPGVCSDSSLFAVPVFSGASFTNDTDGLEFGQGVVQVTPEYTTAKVLAGLSTSVPIPTTSTSYASLSAKWYVGSGSATSDKITNWEQDKNFTCLQGYSVDASRYWTKPYTHGSTAGPVVWTAAATSLSAKDTVFFTCWMFPQQLQKCCDRGATCCNVVNASDATNEGGNCCVTGVCTSAGGTCTNTTVDPAKNSSAIVYRPYNVYFHTVAGTGADGIPRFCDEAGGTEARVLFNGAVRVPDRYGDPLFAYEPNPFRSPFDSAQSGFGARLGVPISFSLLHSADGSDAASGSYLAQIVRDGPCSQSSSSSSLAYDAQCGWKALAALWNKLAGSLSASDGTATSASSPTSYASFVRSYYVHAVSTRFLLALYQLAPCACVDGESNMSVAVFCTPSEWTSLVVSTVPALATVAAGATLAATNAGLPTLQTVLDGLASSPLLVAAQPGVSPLQSDGTVTVTLTLPSLLRRFVPSGLSALLLRAFPRTGVSGGALVPDNVFDPAQTWDYVAATDVPTEQEVFQVVPSSVQIVSYYSAGPNGTLPTASRTAPQPGSPSAALLGLTVTFKVLVAPGTFTMLFYLYYLSRNGNVPIPVAGLVAEGETMSRLIMPSVLDADSAAEILAAGACTADETTFTGAGAWRLNALLLGPQSQACKCLMPSTGPLTPEALCFNANCASRPPYLTVNMASLLTSTSSSSSLAPEQVCPALCGAYLESLEAGAVDALNVNNVALEEYCGVSLSSAQDAASIVPATAAYLASGVLACVAMPLLYLTVLATSLSRNMPFAQTLAARPSFFVTCLALAAILCAAFAYFWTDCRGVQVCSGRSTADADGFTYPSSQCWNAGVLSQPFTAITGKTLPRYVLPQEMCAARPSYCQCDNATLLMCAAGGCGCNSTQCCSVDGICASPDLVQVSADDGTGNVVAGASGRPIRFKPVSSNFSFLTALLCACLALAIVPAAVVGTVYGMHASSLGARVAAGVAVLLCTLAVCCVPLMYRAIKTVETTAVGIGSCPRLQNYPDTLVETTRPEITYVRGPDDAAGLPTYVRTVAGDACAGCCVSAGTSCAQQDGATCPAGCTCTWSTGIGCYESPPATLSYNASLKMWTMTPTSAALPTLYNVAGTSAVLFQDDTRPALYASFTDASKTAANTYTFCGMLQGVSTCAAS
jgi:hypothetical protein